MITPPATSPESLYEATMARAEGASQRWDALRWLWRHSTLDAVRLCRKVGQVHPDGVGGLHVTHVLPVERRPDGLPYVGGLRTCASPWSCPCCAHNIAVRRAGEIQRGVDEVLRRGHSVAFLTLTVQHAKNQPLIESWQALTESWSRAVQGPAWRRAQERAGVLMPPARDLCAMCGEGKGAHAQGMPEAGHEWEPGGAPWVMRVPAIRAVEATTSPRAGWHPHLHMILVTRRGDTPAQTKAIQREMVEGILSRYRGQLRKHGRSLADRGWNLQSVHDHSAGGAALGDYLSKAVSGLAEGLGMELAGQTTKRGHAESMTPFELLGRLASGVRGRDYYTMRALWAEWEQTTKGRHQIVWSNGLKAWLGLDEESTDDELSQDTWHDGGGGITLADKPHYRSPIGPNEWLGEISVGAWCGLVESGAWSEITARCVDDPHLLRSVVQEWGTGGVTPWVAGQVDEVTGEVTRVLPPGDRGMIHGPTPEGPVSRSVHHGPREPSGPRWTRRRIAKALDREWRVLGYRPRTDG